MVPSWTLRTATRLGFARSSRARQVGPPLRTSPLPASASQDSDLRAYGRTDGCNLTIRCGWSDRVVDTATRPRDSGTRWLNTEAAVRRAAEAQPKNLRY